MSYSFFEITNPKVWNNTVPIFMVVSLWMQQFYKGKWTQLLFLQLQHGESPLYVPDCTPDGRYQRVQCYNSTPYCWCVNEDTGKNIPGTSVKDRRPQCDSVYTISRTMKGCPDDRKIVFLKDLKEFLKNKIITGAHAG